MMTRQSTWQCGPTADVVVWAPHADVAVWVLHDDVVVWVPHDDVASLMMWHPSPLINYLELAIVTVGFCYNSSFYCYIRSLM